MSDSSDNKMVNGTAAGSAKAEVSLSEELQSIASELIGAESDAEVEKGLARIRSLREKYSSAGAGADAARQNAEALISMTEVNLEKLRRYLAYKRRLQEGESMEKIAVRREAETDIAPAVYAAAAAFVPALQGESGKPKEEEKKPSAKAAAKEAAPSPAAAQVKEQETPKPAETPRPPAPEAKKPPAFKWSRSYLLTAHMAGSLLEDARYFEKLRRVALKPGQKLPAPTDHREAEAHFKAVHSMNVRLVNIELKVRAIAEAYKKQDPVSDLFKTASNEIKNFMRDLKENKTQRPGMSDEYERLFGGYADKFATFIPTKGEDILARCLNEQRNGMAAANEPEGPQAAVRRDER